MFFFSSAAEIASPAGSSGRWPWATAHFITVPMRRLTRPAVSVFVVQIGSSTAMRSVPVTASTGIPKKGRCKLCGSSAPSPRPEGRPYLEIQQVNHLADGGADTPDNAVALCPVCHREAHYGDRADAIHQELLDRVAPRRQN